MTAPHVTRQEEMEMQSDPQEPNSPEGLEMEQLLCLQSPEKLAIIQDWQLTDKVRRALDLFCRIAAFTSDKEALIIVEDALAVLGPLTESLPSLENNQIPAGDKIGMREYDGFFGVIRTSETPALHWAFSLFMTYRNLLLNAEKGLSLTPTEWMALKASFGELAKLLRSAFNLETKED